MTGRPFAQRSGRITLNRIHAGLLAAFAAIVANASSARAGSYSYLSFDAPGCIVTIPTAVNDRGQGVGASTAARLTPVARVGEILDHGTRKLLLAPGATQSLIAAINQAREVLGQSDPDIGAGGPGFVLSGGSCKFIPKPETNSYLLLTGIDEDGRVLGGVSPSRFVARGFVYANGKFASVVFPGVQYTVPTALNGHGVMVGSLAAFGQSPGSFLRLGERYYPFNYPGSLATEIGALAADDTIVGDYDSGNFVHGFIATCAPDQGPCTP